MQNKVKCLEKQNEYSYMRGAFLHHSRHTAKKSLTTQAGTINEDVCGVWTLYCTVCPHMFSAEHWVFLSCHFPQCSELRPKLADELWGGEMSCWSSSQSLFVHTKNMPPRISGQTEPAAKMANRLSVSLCLLTSARILYHNQLQMQVQKVQKETSQKARGNHRFEHDQSVHASHDQWEVIVRI